MPDSPEKIAADLIAACIAASDWSEAQWQAFDHQLSILDTPLYRRWLRFKRRMLEGYIK